MTDEALYDELMRFYVDNPIKVWVPSLKKRIKFRPVTIEEQTLFINHEAQEGENPAQSLIRGNALLNQVLKNTCLEKDLSDSFNTIDRSIVLMQLRHAVNPMILLTIDEEVHEIDLTPFVENLESKTKPVKYKTKFNLNNFFIDLQVPTLAIDDFYNSYFLHKYGTTKGLDLESIIGDTLFIEAAKFINKITFDSGKVKKVIDFDTLDEDITSDNLNFLKKLPASIIDKVSHFVGNTKQSQTQLLSEKIRLGKKNKNVFLDVDLKFFTTI